MEELMPTFAGIDHLSLSVTDLERSERFYTRVLDFGLAVDFGQARLLIHRATGFGLSLVRHPNAHPGPFSELNPGLDHIALKASNRVELEEWERRLEAAGVVYTPIRDLPFGSHLNFRDPDGVPLELFVPNAALEADWLELRTRDVPRDEINARVRERLLAGGVPVTELGGGAAEPVR
jgi:glyoxylase I family protein